VVGAFSARPVWRMIKAQRAQSFAKEAEALIREEKWAQAHEKLRLALQLAPKHPATLRLTAYFYARAGVEMAFPYFESLLATPSATPEDREEFAALALRTGHTEIAAGQIRDLLAAPKPTPRTFLLASQFHGGLRNFSNAIHYAREAVRLESSNPTNLLSLGRVLLFSRNPDEQKEARDLLWPLARKDSPYQTAAIAAILSTTDSPRAEREEILSILDAKPKRTIGEEILRQDTAVSLDPSQRSTIADGLIETHGRTSIENTAAVAAWLNRQQLYSRTLDLILPDTASQSPDLVQLRYDALMGLEDYRGAYDFISKATNPSNPLQIELLRCSTAIRLKDQPAIDSHFQNLLTIAGREPRFLRVVADFAIRNGRKDVANESAQRLSRNPRDAAAAYATLLKIADGQGETWAARDYAKKLSELRKSDADETLRLQVAYYDLLLNENVDAAFATAEAMYKAQPDDFSRRVVLGLGHLRKNQPKAAVDLIDHQFVTWAKLPPGIRAVTIAILGANQREKASAKLVARTPIMRLKPEEKELIRPYAVGIQGQNDDLPEPDAKPEKL